jgi:hypothetical protein
VRHRAPRRRAGCCGRGAAAAALAKPCPNARRGWQGRRGGFQRQGCGCVGARRVAQRRQRARARGRGCCCR